MTIIGLPEPLPPLPPSDREPMRVLVACESSARVRDAFRQRGHDAVSVDLEKTEGDPENHYRADILEFLGRDSAFDLMIAFPPCTYLTRCNGPRWDRIEKERGEALEFVQALMDAAIPSICIENPGGAISTFIRKPDQYVDPWHFGEPYTKHTGLWLKNLPLLRKEYRRKPDNCRAWVKSTHPNFLGVSRGVARDSKLRSRTFWGIARAMAMQWG